ncbi:uncharacterized protein [Nicotiana tomentosiformis]|uniref:uncharacterized protein n=1 Tax=Nicotiana tomentosiformis TaxID=4098 RepID=UPI00388CB2AC
MSFEALLRLDKFTKLFYVHFSGAPSEDPRDYLDRCHEVLRNIGIVKTNGVNFAVFQITGSAKRGWRDYTLTRPAGSPALTWDQISQLFLEKFIPATLREDYRMQFEPLQQGSMTVTQSLKTSGDLLLLDMVDFDVILGMDWLLPYHATLDCHPKTVTLAMPGLPQLEWRRTLGHSTSRVISYVKDRCMVEKGCLAYLAYVHDSSAEVPSMDSVTVLCEFPEVFPADLSGMPPDKDIDFCIDLALGT